MSETAAAPAPAPVADGGQATDAINPQTPEAQQEAPPPKKVYRYKVNGREVEEDEDTVLKRAQMGHAAYEKFEEAANARKEFAAAIEMMKTDPVKAFKTLEKFGIDGRKAAEAYLRPQYERELMDPKEREMLELREKAEAAQRELEERNKSDEQKRAEMETQRAREAIEQDFINILKANPDIPATTQTVARMAYWLERGIEAGINVTPEMLADKIRSEYDDVSSTRLKNLSAERLIKAIGDDKLREIQSYLAQQVNTRQPSRNPPSRGAQPKQAGEDRKLIGTYDPW